MVNTYKNTLKSLIYVLIGESPGFGPGAFYLNYIYSNYIISKHLIY
jgi:hypothetical protein